MEQSVVSQEVLAGAGQDGEAPAGQSLREEPPSQEEWLAPARAELAQAEEALREREVRIEGLQREVASALERYRAVLLASAPDVPEEMVVGDTVAVLEESFGRARGLVERLARRLEERASRGRVPAGSPPRRAPDTGALSPHGKILLGLQRMDRG